jgi:hypothetical protein
MKFFGQLIEYDHETSFAAPLGQHPPDRAGRFLRNPTRAADHIRATDVTGA